MHFSKLNDSKNGLQPSKCIPNNLHSLKTASLKAALSILAMLKSQLVNVHPTNTITDKLQLVKTQPLKLQFSYSPLGNGFSVKFLLLKV